MSHRTALRGQRGASLVVVLALVTFMALLVPAVLGLVSVGARVTGPVIDDRRELYAASSAIDAAVELGRTQPDVGVPGGPCPTQVLEIDALEVTVTCQQHAVPETGCLFLDRFVTYTAEVRRPGETEVLTRAAAEVAYRFDLDAPATVEIRQWRPDASGPVTTLPLPDCTATTTTTTTSTLVPTSTTTSTTSTTTTSTTTTTVPVGDTRTRWTGTARPRSGSEWRAEATLEVTSATGAPVENATVVVQPEYLPSNSAVWVAASQITGTTTAAGTNTFHSAYYRRSGNPSVVQVRFTVVSVATPQGLPWNDAASAPVTVVVDRP
jgi:Tfp pilus assembly protein PilX